MTFLYRRLTGTRCRRALRHVVSVCEWIWDILFAVYVGIYCTVFATLIVTIDIAFQRRPTVSALSSWNPHPHVESELPSLCSAFPVILLASSDHDRFKSIPHFLVWHPED